METCWALGWARVSGARKASGRLTQRPHAIRHADRENAGKPAVPTLPGGYDALIVFVRRPGAVLDGVRMASANWLASWLVAVGPGAGDERHTSVIPVRYRVAPRPDGPPNVARQMQSKGECV